MNVVETIQDKVFHLPRAAQEEVLEMVERVEERYQHLNEPAKTNGAGLKPHPLRMIADLATDVGVADFAERHDFYANGKLED